MNPLAMSRRQALSRLESHPGPWDIIVIGGGATGVGIAIDAATRGLNVVLLEQADFGKGTSSRSTKLVHGGVRYLRQGNFTLVRDALRERSLLRKNAPHLVHDLSFVIPCRSYWDKWTYGLGLKLYDFLSTGDNFGRSKSMSVAETTKVIPALIEDDLKGGVLYHDGQFDDARLLVNMAQTAFDSGACLLNHMAVMDLRRDAQGKINGVVASDQESGGTFTLEGQVVINATGPFADAVTRMDDPNAESMIATSQGIHLVIPREFFPGENALIVPKTSDGRVIFIIPWHEHAIVGTTDTPIPQATLEPTPQDDEIQFLIDTSAKYLSRAPQREDILGFFTGIRPLVKGDKSSRTASLSRDHTIRVSQSGLITIAGGKWTTYRKMAEDCVDRAIKEHPLRATPCRTKSLALRGACEAMPEKGFRGVYGSDLDAIEQIESSDTSMSVPLTQRLDITPAMIVWAIREEMACTVEDVLARRTRALFLDPREAIAIAPKVARIMATELGYDDPWCQTQVDSFKQTASAYLP